MKINTTKAANLAGERRAIEADLGPVRYLATLLAPRMNHHELLHPCVALLLDPAAVSLLLAATDQRTLVASRLGAVQQTNKEAIR